MERVVGIGGFFFLADDPNQLSRWYAANLGVEPPPQSYGGEVWMQEAGATVFAPFGRAAAERVKAAGADLLWRETHVPHTIDPRVLPELQAFVAAATR